MTLYLSLFKANQRVMTFRNMIGKQGVHHVQAYLKMKKFNVHNTKEYVERAFNYHGKIPFLYQTFEVTDKVVNTQEEAGGYKVVRSLGHNLCLCTYSHVCTGLPWALLPQSNHTHDDVILSSHQVHHSHCSYDWD